jgi:hypothetical protein
LRTREEFGPLVSSKNCTQAKGRSNNQGRWQN